MASLVSFVELGYPPSQPTPLYEENKLSIHIVNNVNDMGRTKLMNTRYHYVRELFHTIQLH